MELEYTGHLFAPYAHSRPLKKCDAGDRDFFYGLIEKGGKEAPGSFPHGNIYRRHAIEDPFDRLTIYRTVAKDL